MLYRTVKVICPRDTAHPEPRTIQLTGVSGTDAGQPLWYCNGCDFMSGDSLCRQCAAAVSIAFTNEPDLSASVPLRPLDWLAEHCKE